MLVGETGRRGRRLPLRAILLRRNPRKTADRDGGCCGSGPLTIIPPDTLTLSLTEFVLQIARGTLSASESPSPVSADWRLDSEKHSVDQPPEPDEVSKHLSWPIFVKGARQRAITTRGAFDHPEAEAFGRAMEAFRPDPICDGKRLFAESSFRYDEWKTHPNGFRVRLNSARSVVLRTGGFRPLSVARQTLFDSRRRETACDQRRQGSSLTLKLPFLVVDAIARRRSLIVIECNDAQASGYTGVSPLGLCGISRS